MAANLPPAQCDIRSTPDSEVLKRLRPEYAEDADGLTAASHVVALNFQTVAAANGYWKES